MVSTLEWPRHHAIQVWSLTKSYAVTRALGESGGLVSRRPFRWAHHTICDAGLIGRGAIPRPGDVSLAHNGIVFLDELPEFARNVLEDGWRCNNLSQVACL